MTLAYVGLGSNLGDRESLIRRAAELIGATRMSTIVETEPWGYENQPRFLNAVAEVDTELTPRQLLDHLLDVERRLGRVRTVRYGPRTCDLDILLAGDEVADEDGLAVPHPRLAERRFALEPLLELDPGAELPDGTPLALLLDGVRAQGVRRLRDVALR